ncbi:P-loop containing nucleoside triphosphate hydrolase protein [Schizophyllum commune Tattone D]|nr:P-loop containing nucleoside triphosphate hydrolase protein [Schizophyllum commune Tattone D]
MPNRGAFIVIEGLDRSGKSTQAARLKERLASDGTKVELMKFPDRTTAIGKMIDAYLRTNIEMDDHVVHLLYSANRWELASRISTLLAEGTTIICDRYAFSGIAFSASKVASTSSSTASTSTSSTSTSTASSASQPSASNPAAPTSTPAQPASTSAGSTSAPLLPYAWCRAPDIGLPAPDVTLFFDIAPEAARARGGYGEERYEREDVQRRVMEVYARLGAEMEAARPGSWVRVDAARAVDEVAGAVWEVVDPLLHSGNGGDGSKGGVEGEVGRLWEGELA